MVLKTCVIWSQQQPTTIVSEDYKTNKNRKCLSSLAHSWLIKSVLAFNMIMADLFLTSFPFLCQFPTICNSVSYQKYVYFLGMQQ